MLHTLHRILQSIYVQYIMYCDNSIFLLLFFCSLVYLSTRGKEFRCKLVYPSLLMITVIFNPYLYVRLFDKIFVGTYWRFMWMVPVIPVVALTLVILIYEIKRCKWRVFFVALFVYVITCLGENIYIEKKQFTQANNPYKIPKDCVDLVDCILEIESHPKVIATQDTYCYLRQYSSSIKQVYGRDYDNFIAPWNTYSDEITKNIIYNMQSDNPMYHRRVQAFENGGVQFVIDETKSEMYDTALEHERYSLIGEISHKRIYYNKDVKANNWRVIQRGYNDNTERMAYVLNRLSGELVLIDGGWGDSNWFFDQYISENNQYVDMWILTTLTPAHIELFIKYAENDDVIINEVLVSEFGLKKLEYENPELYNELSEALNNCSKVQLAKNTESYWISDLEIIPIYTESKEGDYTSYTSMVFMIKGEENTMLFLADAGEECLNDLKKFNDIYSVDFLEISFHNKIDYKWILDMINPIELMMDCSSERGNEIKQELDSPTRWSNVEEYDFGNLGYVELR